MYADSPSHPDSPENAFETPDLGRIRQAVITGPHPSAPAPGRFDPTSVMALVMEKPELSLFFIQKADVKGYPWANQMAFPGGHQEETDADSEQTALRELHEETGIRPENVRVTGSLGHFQTLNNKDIEAWTGIWNQADTVVFETAEIARVFHIPLARLMDHHCKAGFHIRVPDFTGLIYPWQDVQIWGVTAKILCHLINLILKT